MKYEIITFVFVCKRVLWGVFGGASEIVFDIYEFMRKIAVGHICIVLFFFFFQIILLQDMEYIPIHIQIFGYQWCLSCERISFSFIYLFFFFFVFS